MELALLHTTFSFGLFGVGLFLIALLYAMVGHGGGSGYIALMLLFSFPMEVVRPTALLFNIVVSGLAYYFFQKQHTFRTVLFFPLAMASIPMAFIGGIIPVNPWLFKVLMGVFLLFSAGRLMSNRTEEFVVPRTLPITVLGMIGGVIGLMSGIIGIGGGIILSPVLLLLGLGNVKEVAAMSALFVFVNSLAGLLGYSIQMQVWSSSTMLFVPLILVGGWLGGFLGSRRMTSHALKYVLVSVLLLATFKIWY